MLFPDLSLPMKYTAPLTLDALGVKVDALDKRVAVIEERLGGWKLSGSLRVDIENRDKDAPESDGSSEVSRSRLIFER